MKSGQLWIGDRGYATSSSIEQAHDKGAAILIRYNHSSLPLFRTATDQQPLDPVPLLRRYAKIGTAKSVQVYIKPKQGQPIQGYLHFRKMSKKKADRAQAKLVRERKAAGRLRPSEATLQLAACHIVFTTVPKSRISASDCLDLYRLRWQIELHNKREKSVGGLDGLPNFRPDTIHTWLSAKLLLTQLCMKMVESGAESLPGSIACHKKKLNQSISAARPKSTQHPNLLRYIDEVWRLFRLAWSVLQAALLPISLGTFVDTIRSIKHRLDKTKDSRNRPKQIAKFADALVPG
jgi:hypothetical protein